MWSWSMTGRGKLHHLVLVNQFTLRTTYAPAAYKGEDSFSLAAQAVPLLGPLVASSVRNPAGSIQNGTRTTFTSKLPSKRSTYARDMR
jgi:hypothetical protein